MRRALRRVYFEESAKPHRARSLAGIRLAEVLFSQRNRSLDVIADRPP
jgi:hypothetical protein